MITGEVQSTREAVLQLRLLDTKGKAMNVEAVIDTGFTDYLTLPSSIIESEKLTFMYATSMQLADGSSVEMKVYEAVLEWDDQERVVLAHGAEGSPLIGMAILYGSRLTMDVVGGGSVTITSLP